MKSLTPPLMPSIDAELTPPPDAAEPAELLEAAALDAPDEPPPPNREVPDDLNPPDRLPPLAPDEPALLEVVPLPDALPNAEATADVAELVLEDEEPDEEDDEPPPPPPPDEIVTTMPPRPPPPKLDTDIPPPRPPRSCGATSDT